MITENKASKWDFSNEVAKAYKDYIKNLPGEINLPTGSGETLVCLKMAFPYAKINAVYNIDDATLYNKEAPLNVIVGLLAERVFFNG